MIKTGVAVISALGFLAFVATGVILLLYSLKKLLKIRLYDKLQNLLQPFTYQLAFFLALTATLASLFLSEVLHFQPCILCWYQRVAMYPQVVLLYVAQLRRERVLTPYLLAINVIGSFISLYHYSLHVLPRTLVPIMPCSTQLGGVPCDKGYDFYFGFMTFPLMAWSVFALIIFLLIASRQKFIAGKSVKTKPRKRGSKKLK